MRRALFVLILLITGCGTHAYHRVQRGDSLYSISWSYGYDYRDVAKWNNLQSPYSLKEGQHISFIPPVGTVVHAPVKPVLNDSVARAPRQIPATPSEKFSSDITWQWPTNGSVLNRFDVNNSSNKGINISGQLGQPVRASASGKVVYSGSGLIGYGKLIILKHNETLLSAYAHNKNLLVTEGEFVDAGKQIAEMGSSGANDVMLHFEIRRDGVPVDPLGYLPERKLQ